MIQKHDKINFVRRQSAPVLASDTELAAIMEQCQHMMHSFSGLASLASNRTAREPSGAMYEHPL